MRNQTLAIACCLLAGFSISGAYAADAATCPSASTVTPKSCSTQEGCDYSVTTSAGTWEGNDPYSSQNDKTIVAKSMGAAQVSKGATYCDYEFQDAKGKVLKDGGIRLSLNAK
ncbi:hypothetical protein FHW69_002674 [Luteibacter sp. Sphag1AF]|uniref:hypothetical protein n=1 Tax=Luteibacter sp. Sphag1AF TaxID=2587031 RepID=UPI00161520BB|nr:hypothetical protein [Luteibacter sp. Sphag1AF]MBB3228039.1 hypothetical protein [Luteibacter sp. Sphag1AF]